jgi:hypothetical protein
VPCPGNRQNREIENNKGRINSSFKRKTQFLPHGTLLYVRFLGKGSNGKDERWNAT